MTWRSIETRGSIYDNAYTHWQPLPAGPVA
jgi:hypothetical protein